MGIMEKKMETTTMRYIGSRNRSYGDLGVIVGLLGIMGN